MRRGIALCCWSCWAASVTTGGPIALASAGGVHMLPSSPTHARAFAHGAWGHGGGPRGAVGPLLTLVAWRAIATAGWPHMCVDIASHISAQCWGLGFNALCLWATLGPWRPSCVVTGGGPLSLLLVGTRASSTCPVHAPSLCQVLMHDAGAFCARVVRRWGTPVVVASGAGTGAIAMVAALHRCGVLF
jgi:hypothetical protein